MRLSCLLLLIGFLPANTAGEADVLTVRRQQLTSAFRSEQTAGLAAALRPAGRVLVELPGLLSAPGFYGRDQASLAFEAVFAKIEVADFELTDSPKTAVPGGHSWRGAWRFIGADGHTAKRDVFFTLSWLEGSWYVTEIRMLHR